MTTATVATNTFFPSWVRPVPLGRAGLVATVTAAASGALLAGWWWALMGGAGWTEALVCSAPALAAAALALASQDDRRQYVVRLFAAAMMLPLLAGFVATSADGPWTALNIVALLAWFVLHLASVVPLVAWMASGTTRLESAAGIPPAAAAQNMSEALRELARQGLPLGVHDQGRGHWIVECPAPEQRTHRIELRIDALRSEIRVREVVGAEGTAPADAGEASMRGPGETWFDPTRPSAARVWNRRWQATVLEPARLAALRFDAGSALPLPVHLVAAAAEPEAAVHLLAALALRAGLAWQPTLGRP